ncbi:Protein kinase domain-containing protein [Aphelenchoides fujianensis]|nr:Protein kinase domain-containing protein [Aphelenchoides fujianensis]
MGDPNWKSSGEEKPPAGNSNDAPEEEDVGYQRRIKIRLPPGTKEDDDPFLDPASLLPINDSFGHVIVPLNPDGLSCGAVPPPEATGGATADEHVAQPAAPTHPTDSETTTTPQTHSTSPPTIPDGLPPPPSASPGTTPVRQGLPLLPLSTMGGTGTTVLQREMCLSVKWADQVQHFLLQATAAGLYALNEDPKQAFPGVLELVNFHLRTGTPFGRADVVLINPIVRQDWEFRQDQIRLLRPIGSGADIAARNCLYGRKVVKLSDFGLSRQCPTYVMEGSEKAPLRWLAPEVFRSQICSFASDVWAFGVLVWEIFTNGAEPYAGWTGNQIKEEVMNRKYRLMAPEWTPQVVKDLLLQCFLEDPEKRAPMSTVVLMLQQARKGAETPPAQSQLQAATPPAISARTQPTAAPRPAPTKLVPVPPAHLQPLRAAGHKRKPAGTREGVASKLAPPQSRAASSTAQSALLRPSVHSAAQSPKRNRKRLSKGAGSDPKGQSSKKHKKK